MRSGDIDDRILGMISGIEGIMAHKKMQELYDEHTKKELPLKIELEMEDIKFKIQGRADGVKILDGKYSVNEIKSTRRNLDEFNEDSNPLHWAQAKCYAHILAQKHNLRNVQVILTYYNLKTEENKKLSKIFTKAELNNFFENLIKNYLRLSKLLANQKIELQKTATKLAFPFEKYRNGQRELAIAVYNTIREEKILYADAPTGIGKTISVIYPAIKSIGTNVADKIFYTTARNTQHMAAESALELVEDFGLSMKSITLVAKEKICILDKPNCNPDACNRAKGHYDRVNDAIFDILENENRINRNVLEDYANRYNICPFEFQLNLSEYVHAIICDYNYIFDPFVYLRRYFDVTVERTILLIDEAHNLIDRTRKMYTAEISLGDFEKLMENEDSLDEKIINAIKRIIFHFGNIQKNNNIKDRAIEEKINIYIEDFKNFIDICDEYFKSEEELEAEIKEELLDIYFKIFRYLKIDELYSENYLTYISNNNSKIEIANIDPSEMILSIIKKVHASVFFSATLKPINYYRRLITRDEEVYNIELPTPFDKNRLCTIRAPISTKYKDRQDTKYEIANCLNDFIKHDGNYLIFFPSYAYMEMLSPLIYADNLTIQENFMKEHERKEFLNKFQNDKNHIGLAVLGGIFAEGINLVGDRLNGIAIVSIGLPGFDFKTEAIKNFFNKRMENGYDYAYKFPAINRVSQAGGRLIRSKDDFGELLLIDDRYFDKSYVKYLPNYWKPFFDIYNEQQMKNLIKIHRGKLK